MKKLFTISLLIVCILFSSIAVIYSTNDPDLLKADELSMLSTEIDDETYAVLIFTGSKIYFDQFEFDAGDVFNLTSEEGDYTGSWTATDIAGFTYFTAKVEEPDITTTTTTTTETENQVASQAEFTINIWGFVTGCGLMIGGGAYFDADVFFLGYTKRVEGEDPEFAGISPNSATQGDQNVVVVITGTNTNFETGETTVSFSGEGITVSPNPDIEDETELSVEIDIAEDADVGFRSVTVIYPGGSIVGEEEFEVLRKE